MSWNEERVAAPAAGLALARPGAWEIAALAALAALYLPVLPVMARVWNRPDSSHGFIVPFAALYLAWLERDRLRAAPVRPREAWGIAVVLAGVGVLLLGRAGTVAMLQIASLPVILTGAVLALYGLSVLRVLALPLGYLFFMVPFLDLVMSRLHPPLQAVSAVIAAKMLALAGLPVHREGLFLELPRVTLQVADECSGLRYLVSLLAVGVPLAWHTQRRTARRLAFLAVCALIGVLTNGLRIAFIGIYNHVFGGAIHGPGHVFQGVFVSTVGYGFIGLAAWAMQSREGREAASAAPSAATQRTTGPVPRGGLRALTLIFGAAALSGFLVREEAVPLSRPLESLPLSVGVWEGRPLAGGDVTPELKRAEFDLLRRYRAGRASEAVLLLRYLESQAQGRELVFYTLQRLYDSGQSLLLTDAEGAGFTATQTVFYDRVSKRHVAALYWHEIERAGIGSRYRAKLQTALGRLFTGRTNGALVVLYADAPDPRAATDLLPMLTGFAEDVRPQIVGLLPSAGG